MPPVPKSSHCDIRLNTPENSGVTAELCLCWDHLTTTAKDISRALQTLARAGAPVDLHVVGRPEAAIFIRPSLAPHKVMHSGRRLMPGMFFRSSAVAHAGKPALRMASVSRSRSVSLQSGVRA